MTEKEKRDKIINRLKTIKGHIEGVEKMILDEKPCKDVLLQLAAIRSSVNNAGIELLKNNAEDCFVKDDLTSDDLNEVIDTIIKYTNK